MNLPQSDKIPVHLLAAVFANRTATYKFYWLLSIIQEVELGNSKISKRNLFIRMIANAWYTVNYFHVSFGVHDKLQEAIFKLKEIEGITIDETFEKIILKLKKSNNPETLKTLDHFDNNVPHWFLTPWYPRNSKENESRSKARIYAESLTFNTKNIYALYPEKIEINPNWVTYLSDNSRVLKDFCFWNLSLFLQAKNPNVPDIPNKLIKKVLRANLKKQRKFFWELLFDELHFVKCIYTGKDLVKSNFAMEHFIPHAFVSHDLIWNLIPAESSYNSTKNDKIPRMERFFEPYFNLQLKALKTVYSKQPHNKYLQEYLTFIPELSMINNSSEETLKARFFENVSPLATIAVNNGFQYLNA